MKKNNNMTSFIIAAGIIVIAIFTAVLGVNLLPNYESNSYYSKVGDKVNAKIETLDIKDNMLNITTSGYAKEYCVKTTRTTPELNNVCWNEIEDNTASIAVYKDEKYYVWIKDINDNISAPVSVNSD